MIYVVSGHPRSGTSAMMQALAAGGLPVVTNPVRNTATHHADDKLYKMNPGDVYECSITERNRPEWPRMHDGSAVKCVVHWLGQLAVHEYRVVFMRRHPEEIRQSFNAAFGIVGKGGLTVDKIESRVTEGLNTLTNRRDVLSVSTLWYDQLLASPVAALTALCWPICIQQAASVIDPHKKRFHLPRLTVGV